MTQETHFNGLLEGIFLLQEKTIEVMGTSLVSCHFADFPLKQSAEYSPNHETWGFKSLNVQKYGEKTCFFFLQHVDPAFYPETLSGTISEDGGFHKWGDPKMDGLQGKPPLKLIDDLGVPLETPICLDMFFLNSKL